jgi:hypothetical protein
MTEQIYKIRLKLGIGELEIEGDKSFVTENLHNLLQELHTRSMINPTPDLKITTNVEPATLKQTLVSAKPNLKEFVAETKPSGSLKVAVVLAYYLYKFEKKETFIEDDLKRLWIASGLKPTNSYNQTMNDCKKRHGWFDNPERGIYQITEHGIYFVESELLKK